MENMGLGQFIVHPSRRELREDEWGEYSWREDLEARDAERPGVLRTLAWRMASDLASFTYNVIECPPRTALALSRRYFWRTHTAVTGIVDSTSRTIASIRDEIAFQWDFHRIDEVLDASFEDNFKSLSAKVAGLP